MGHFTIHLPGYDKAEVRWGTIRQEHGLSFLLRKKRENEKIGYIVELVQPDGSRKEYRLLKEKEGNWLHENVCGFGTSEHDEVVMAIQSAIEKHERHCVSH
ncbi:MAG: hypothetical protein ACJ75B_13920 [Flavisolibacter sp.]